MSASMAAVARHFLFVRETEGPNAGFWVDYFLRFTGNVEGESWCASFVSKVNDIATKGQMTVTRTAGTTLMMENLRAKGRLVTTPQVDDLVFSVNPDGTAHHVAIVTGVNPLTAIAGNTSESGLSDNGTGVFEHPISAAGKVFARLPV